MQIKKSKKTDVTASRKKSVYDFTQKDREMLRNTAAFMRRKLMEHGYSKEEVNNMGITELDDLCNELGIDIVYSSDSCNSSAATDKALKHIKAAIDILATEDSEVAKDSIANLATVMFDIKGSTEIDK